MAEGLEFGAFLKNWAGRSDTRSDIAETVRAIGEASLRIREVVARGPLEIPPDRLSDPSMSHDADFETVLDTIAIGIIEEALQSAPVVALAAEQMERPVGLDRERRLLVAVDPLDGSTNLDTNAAIGTIFSVLPRPSGDIDVFSPEAFLQSGEHQLAAGFVVYGPRTTLVITLRDGTHMFTRDPGTNRYFLTNESIQIPPLAREYAINASNYRHWDEATRTYVDDCLKGAEGVRAFDFNMRWIGSLVAEIYRIFSRGGIYLYPADRRDGHAQGRLRLIHEANPISLVVENAGGASSTGRQRILELKPKELQQKIPIVVGSRDEVEYVLRLYTQPHALGERSPLFGNRGLFRM
ncbi:MAG: class 1 fructose-bisphosphatase [Pseudomonadota bacterium]